MYLDLVHMAFRPIVSPTSSFQRSLFVRVGIPEGIGTDLVSIVNSEQQLNTKRLRYFAFPRKILNKPHLAVVKLRLDQGVSKSVLFVITLRVHYTFRIIIMICPPW